MKKMRLTASAALTAAIVSLSLITAAGTAEAATWHTLRAYTSYAACDAGHYFIDRSIPWRCRYVGERTYYLETYT